MKMLVITPKGIGMAEMLEKPIETWPSQEQVQQYESAKEKAISEAPLFEDQERVSDILNHDYKIGGIYPIPPDFPKVVEVRQWHARHSVGWHDYLGPRIEEDTKYHDYRTILRFVDEKPLMGNTPMAQIIDETIHPEKYEKQESEEKIWLDAVNMYLRDYMSVQKHFTLKRK